MLSYNFFNPNFSQKDWKKNGFSSPCILENIRSLSKRDILNALFTVSTSAQDLGTWSSWNWNTVCPHGNAGSKQLAWEEPKGSSGGQSYALPMTYPSTLREQEAGPTLTHDVVSVSLATST